MLLHKRSVRLPGRCKDCISDGIDMDSHDKAADAASSDIYAAEFIVDKKRGSYRGKKVLLYRVRWTGYTAADDTWEPIENLNDVLLSEFEESVKLRRPRPHSTSLPKNTPLVTWSDMMQMLGSCPLERLPNCLRPQSPEKPPLKLKCMTPGVGHNTLERYFSTENFDSALKYKRPVVAEGDAAPETHLTSPPAPASGNMDAGAARTQSDRISCTSRPRLKQAVPSRSPLANVVMSC